MYYIYILTTVLAEILLPFADTFLNINLGTSLVIDGHPIWGTWVFFPVIAKTCFTLFACKRIENKNWIFHTPLVFFQIYPQFCFGRLLVQWLAKKLMDTKEFKKEHDNLAGSIGFLHVIQAVPQGFIQTAFFAVSHILPTKIKQFCFNEKVPSCRSMDNCTTVIRNTSQCPNDFSYQSTSCNKIQYEPYKYKTFKEIHDCEDMVQKCSEMFESCLQPFNECIQKCENELNERINSMDEEVLLQLRSNMTTNVGNNFLTEEFGATPEDLKSIQIDLLYRRNEFWFLFTYIVSIIAAMYGITKFFRLTYSRHCDKFTKRTQTITSNPEEEFVNQGLNYVLYGITCTISGIYLVGKGLVLSRFMWMNENTMGMNVGLWLVFCMVPSLIFAFFTILRWTCEKSDDRQLFGHDVYKTWMLKVFFKEPAIFGIPFVSPFMYKVKTIGCTRDESIDDHKMTRYESEAAFFNLSYHLSYINNGLTIFMGSIGLITHGNLEFNFVFAVASSLLFLTSILIFLIQKLDGKGSEKCFEDGKPKSKCTDCGGKYGLHIKDYQKIEICKAHEMPDCSFCSSFLKMGNSNQGAMIEDERTRDEPDENDEIIY